MAHVRVCDLCGSQDVTILARAKRWRAVQKASNMYDRYAGGQIDYDNVLVKDREYELCEACWLDLLARRTERIRTEKEAVQAILQAKQQALGSGRRVI